MTSKIKLSKAIIAYTQSFPDIKSGIVRLTTLFQGNSYQIDTQKKKNIAQVYKKNRVISFRKKYSVLVLALKHAPCHRELDWWQNGNTSGNKKLMDISTQIIDWLSKDYKINARQLAYHIEKGGIYLKDAAVMAGLGVIGTNNLLINPEWGSNLRLRSILIEKILEPTQSIRDFFPCETCEKYCIRECPVNAFPYGKYSRSICQIQMFDDEDQMKQNKTDLDSGLIKYCRSCELACPVGRGI